MEVILESAVETIRQRVEETIQYHHVHLSSHAQLLLATILTGILVDRPSQWDLSSSGMPGTIAFETPDAALDYYLDKLPTILTNLFPEEGTVTSFDLLHGIGQRLDSLCVITKI